MDEAKRQAVQFLEKEIKTYKSTGFVLVKKRNQEAPASERQRRSHPPNILQRKGARGQGTHKGPQTITLEPALTKRSPGNCYAGRAGSMMPSTEMPLCIHGK